MCRVASGDPDGVCSTQLLPGTPFEPMKTEKRKAEIAAYQKEYRKNNSDRLRNYDRVKSLAWYHKNRNSLTDEEKDAKRIERAKYKKQYNESLTDEQRAAAKSYFAERYQRVKRPKTAEEKAVRNANRKNKLKTDPSYRLDCAVRGVARSAFKRQGYSKSESTNKLLGCSPSFLRDWISSKFKRGMTLENYGHKTWHIDHIIPLSTFDLSDPNQAAIACHYTNLQPMWAKENITKGAKITHPQMSLLLSEH